MENKTEASTQFNCEWFVHHNDPCPMFVFFVLQLIQIMIGWQSWLVLVGNEPIENNVLFSIDFI